MSEVPAAIKGYTIKSFNETTDFSEAPDGLWEKKGIEVLIIPEEGGETAYEWKRCVVVQHGVGIPFAHRCGELLYKTGERIWTNVKPEGWGEE